jgi:hypothetical protein
MLRMKFCPYTNNIMVEDTVQFRTAHVRPNVLKAIGGDIESLANQAMESPSLWVDVPHNVRPPRMLPTRIIQ